jgi:calpain-15
LPNNNSIIYLHPNSSAANEVSEDELELLKKFTWKRAAEIQQGKIFTLYHKIEIEDINQGFIGNCYFLSALSAIAEFKDRFDNIFISKTKTENGCYTVKFILKGIPKILSIDDYFLYDSENEGPAGANSGQGEIWVEVLEKAWAKVNGSYAATISGLPGEALAALTEAPVVSYIHKKYKDSKIEELWDIIKQADKNNWIICTSTGDNKNAEAMGLIQSHAYTLIGVNEDQNIRLVKLRNPWGNFEWKGDFSDSSPLWNQYPKLKNYVALDKKDDGIFYMTFNDFLIYYPYTYICMYEESFKYRFKKIHQKRNDLMTVVKIKIVKPTCINIGLHQKQQRFYTKVPGYKSQMTRIILAKYNRNNKNPYEFINSDSNDNEKLYIREEILQPGEYHIFGNVNWPYETRCRYVISTYANVSVDISELNVNLIPNNYLTLILNSFLEKKCKVDQLNENLSYIQSFNDNDTGFYMLSLKNNTLREKLRINLEFTKNKNCILLTENLTSEAKSTDKTDSFSVLVNRNSNVTLIWLLMDNFWHSRMNLNTIDYELDVNATLESYEERRMMR